MKQTSDSQQAITPESCQGDKVIFESRNQVGYLTLNNPDKRNAFDDEIIACLLQKLEVISQTPSLRVLVLQANGKHFSAGADLAWMKRMAQLNYDDNLKDAYQLANLMRTLDQLAIPTIAKIQGAVFGGAVGLVSCCDIAIAQPDARFCLSEVKLGLAPATISPYVINAMGGRRCRHLFLTAEVFSAQQAADYGLIHEIAESEQIESRIEELIGQIKQTGPCASRACKKLIHEVVAADSHTDLFRDTSELIARMRVAEEGQEGLSAFFEKRSPAWFGRTVEEQEQEQQEN